MTRVPLTYAKAHFSELAAKVAQGKEILVTRHEKPLVKLVPVNRVSQDGLQELFTEMDSIRTGARLGPGLSIDDLRKEGQR